MNAGTLSIANLLGTTPDVNQPTNQPTMSTGLSHVSLVIAALQKLESELKKAETAECGADTYIEGIGMTLSQLKDAKNGMELLVKAHNDLHKRVKALEENS